jgi:hypothetical protein
LDRAGGEDKFSQPLLDDREIIQPAAQNYLTDLSDLSQLTRYIFFVLK